MEGGCESRVKLKMKNIKGGKSSLSVVFGEERVDGERELDGLSKLQVMILCA